MKTDLLERAKQAAELALCAGADDARAYASRAREVRVEWRDGKLDRIRENTTQTVSVGLFVDGRYSTNGTSDLRPEALDAFVRESVQATRLIAPDHHRRLPEAERYEGRIASDLQLRDPALSAVTPDQRLQKARSLEKAAREAPGADKIISVTTSVSDREGQTAVWATNGLEASKEGTFSSVGANVSVEDEDHRKPSGSGWAGCVFAEDLPEVETVGLDATRRAIAQVGSKQIPTGRYDVIIENRSVGGLSRHLFGPTGGSSVQQKRSFFEGRMGEQVGNELLTITDDPHLLRGPSSGSWDVEGMATKPREIFAGGVLKMFYLGTYYASKLGMEPTTAGRRNLIWQPGDRELGTIVSDTKRGLLVTGFLGGNSNSTTGDFSLGIQGFWIEGGEIVHPVSEVNVAGNHLRFWKKLEEVGNDPWPYSSNRSPTLRFSEVQCSGS